MRFVHGAKLPTHRLSFMRRGVVGEVEREAGNDIISTDIASSFQTARFGPPFKFEISASTSRRRSNSPPWFVSRCVSSSCSSRRTFACSQARFRQRNRGEPRRQRRRQITPKRRRGIVRREPETHARSGAAIAHDTRHIASHTHTLESSFLPFARRGRRRPPLSPRPRASRPSSPHTMTRLTVLMFARARGPSMRPPSSSTCPGRRRRRRRHRRRRARRPLEKFPQLESVVRTSLFALNQSTSIARARTRPSCARAMNSASCRHQRWMRASSAGWGRATARVPEKAREETPRGRTKRLRRRALDRARTRGKGRERSRVSSDAFRAFARGPGASGFDSRGATVSVVGTGADACARGGAGA